MAMILNVSLLMLLFGASIMPGIYGLAWLYETDRLAEAIAALALCQLSALLVFHVVKTVHIYFPRRAGRMNRTVGVRIEDRGFNVADGTVESWACPQRPGQPITRGSL